MGNQTGVVGGGDLKEQLYLAGGSTVAGTRAAAGASLVAPASKSSTITTGGIDRRNYNTAMLNLNVGAVTGAGLFTWNVQDSDDDGVLDAYVDVTAANQGWGDLTKAVGGASQNYDATMWVDLRKCKRWIRFVGTLTSGTSAILGATCVLGAADTLPAA